MSTDIEPSGEITADDLTAALADEIARRGLTDPATDPPVVDVTPASVPSGWGDDDPASTTAPSAEPVATEPSAPTTTPTTEPAVEPATEPAASPYIEIGGRQWQSSDLEQLVGLAEYFSSITPEQAAAIDAIVTGQTPPAPTAPSAPAVQSPATPTSAQSDDDEDFIDPVAAERIRALEAELQGVRQSQTAIERERIQAEQAEHVRIQNAELDTLIGVHGLEPDDRQRIIEAAGRSGMIPTLARQYADPAQVYRIAFTEALWLDPTLRSRMIQRQVDEAMTRARNDDARKLAGSVAGSPAGSISRTAPVTRPSADAPIGERINALAESLKPFIEGS